ncbi:MAG: LuxR C-terminal-related transcriptional regulator [Bacteroidota bacterium]|nr:LuxR C-terminal-related transcriptional regulator [Bacteroidota bacterium]
MLRILVCIVFILSVALTAGGIILTSRLRNRYKSDIFSSLLYFQIFIYTFGFYGIWGQVVIKTFLSQAVSPEVLSRLSDLALLLGLPFLIFAWLMLLTFSGTLTGRNQGRWFVPWFLLTNFSVLVILGFLITGKSSYNTSLIIRYYYIIMNLVYFFVSSYLIHFPWKRGSLIHDYDRRIVSPILFLIMIVQCVPLYFYTNQTWLAVIFIFAFFLGNNFLPLYFSYGTLVPSSGTGHEINTGFEEFCRKYDVSPRESEVIREICNGLSNKEISEKLFISLQTVKDHTHRIYIKTNVRSRVQLINSVKDSINPIK